MSIKLKKLVDFCDEVRIDDLIVEQSENNGEPYIKFPFGSLIVYNDSNLTFLPKMSDERITITTENFGVITNYELIEQVKELDFAELFPTLDNPIRAKNMLLRQLISGNRPFHDVQDMLDHYEKFVS